MSRQLVLFSIVWLLCGLPVRSQEPVPKQSVSEQVPKTASMKALLAQLKPFDPPETAAKLPSETAELFKKMRSSTAANAKVYAALSTDQMNFSPADGSHTPRWNAEHISASQLRFFSQIYHELDPNVPVMDWAPKQMPADYKAAHPKWTGKKEAKRMIAVDDFCQRYAYLLAEVDLDSKPPVTFWTSYRALLTKLAGHSTEHTANVKKKMTASDWPTK